MRSYSHSLLLLTGILLTCPLWSQNYRVSDPRPSLEGNVILIAYDILNSAQEDLFHVRLSVVDVDGNELPAKALSGDVGDDVNGGINKLIRWDLAADGIELEANIYFKVHAQYLPPPELLPEPPVEESPARQDSILPDQGLAELPSPEEKKFTRGGLMLRSLVFPGLGLTKYTGKPHWIKGAIAYGCLAGSVGLNRMAISSYDQIYSTLDNPEREAAYTRSVNMDQASEILAYTAAAIWVVDLVWTFVGTPGKRQMALMPALDPTMGTPLLVFTYRF